MVLFFDKGSITLIVVRRNQVEMLLYTELNSQDPLRVVSKMVTYCGFGT